MSHWYGISFTEYVFECHYLSYNFGQIQPYFVILDDNYEDDNVDDNNDDDNTDIYVVIFFCHRTLQHYTRLRLGYIDEKNVMFEIRIAAPHQIL